jgi:hypothetical protein
VPPDNLVAENPVSVKIIFSQKQMRDAGSDDV